jgi:hypothetical protein
MHLDEIATLKVKVQTLETEKRALKSSCASMDLDKDLEIIRILDIRNILRLQIALN